MNKVKTLIVSIMLTMVAATAYASEAKTQMMDTVWKINDNCSAVVVKSEKVDEGYETFLLTAAHCTPSPKGYVNANVYDGIELVMTRKFWYKRVHMRKQHDLSYIRLLDKSAQFTAAKIAEEEAVDVGGDVYAVGFPKSQVKALTKGMLSQKTDLSRLTSKKSADPVYLTSVPVIGGNSGGGLFQKVGNNYELIGVTTRVMSGFHHVSIFSTLDNIKSFLKYKDVL